MLLENCTFYLIILSAFIALNSDPNNLFYAHYSFYMAQCKECKYFLSYLLVQMEMWKYLLLKQKYNLYCLIMII